MATHLYIADKDTVRAEAREPTHRFRVPADAITVPAQDLYEGLFWVLVRDGTRVWPWFSLSVAAVEEENLGGTVRSHLIHGHPLQSDYYWTPGIDPQDELIIEAVVGVTDASVRLVHRLVADGAERLEELARGTLRRMYLPPPSKLVTPDLPGAQGNGTPEERFRKLAVALKRKYAYDRLHASLSGLLPEILSPYEQIAFHYLTTNDPEHSEALRASVDNGTYVQFAPTTDLSFTTVDPANVTTRVFVPRPPDERHDRYQEALVKTDRAERVHQQMLTDLARRAQKHDIDPRESATIDLLLDGPDARYVIEIKSANSDNFKRQCLRGAIQVLEYRYSLKHERGMQAEPMLVIEPAINEPKLRYYSEFLESLGVRMAPYDANRQWPDRAPDFDRHVLGIVHP